MNLHVILQQCQTEDVSHIGTCLNSTETKSWRGLEKKSNAILYSTGRFMKGELDFMMIYRCHNDGICLDLLHVSTAEGPMMELGISVTRTANHI